jgi:hypothetical protein
MTKHAASLDELLALQNSGAARIRSSEFSSGFSQDGKYSVEMGLRYEYDTISYNLTIDQDKIDGLHQRIDGLHQRIDGLHQRIEAILDESKLWYWWIYRVMFSTSYFMITIICLLTAGAAASLADKGLITSTVPVVVPMGICIIMGLPALLLKCLGPILFPTYGFEIGDGLRRANQARQWRRGIGAVLSTLVVIVAGIVITRWYGRLFG